MLHFLKQFPPMRLAPRGGQVTSEGTVEETFENGLEMFRVTPLFFLYLHSLFHRRISMRKQPTIVRQWH